MNICFVLYNFSFSVCFCVDPVLICDSHSDLVIFCFDDFSVYFVYFMCIYRFLTVFVFDFRVIYFLGLVFVLVAFYVFFYVFFFYFYFSSLFLFSLVSVAMYVTIHVFFLAFDYRVFSFCSSLKFSILFIQLFLCLCFLTLFILFLSLRKFVSTKLFIV
jgi:hypothetical protein